MLNGTFGTLLRDLVRQRTSVLMYNYVRYLLGFQVRPHKVLPSSHLSYITISSLLVSSPPPPTISTHPKPLRPYIFPSALPLSLTSSTLPLPSVIPGTTHSPQLHFIPCHAYLPTLCPHFLFGQNSRPSNFPCSSSGRIHDKGVIWICAQAG